MSGCTHILVIFVYADAFPVMCNILRPEPRVW